MALRYQNSKNGQAKNNIKQKNETRYFFQIRKFVDETLIAISTRKKFGEYKKKSKAEFYCSATNKAQ